MSKLNIKRKRVHHKNITYIEDGENVIVNTKIGMEGNAFIVTITSEFTNNKHQMFLTDNQLVKFEKDIASSFRVGNIEDLNMNDKVTTTRVDGKYYILVDGSDGEVKTVDTKLKKGE